MEQEVMETVLHEILQELRGQQAQLGQLQNGMKEQEITIASIHQKLAKHEGQPCTLSEDQLALLKDFMGDKFETLQKVMILNPTVRQTHKHFSLMPPNFRMEYFPLLVNTVMKWVVVLIVLVFLIWLAVRMINPV
ncbi:MAG: hypothetical protein ACO1OT_02485 [Heyndrickxia sp.]